MLNDYYKKNWLDRNTAFWRQVLEKYSSTVLLENVWEADPEMFRNLLDKVASPRLKFCFDIGHANVYSKVSFEQWISTLCADITHMHLSDNDGAVDQHLEVGKGKIHWRQFTDTLDRYRTQSRSSAGGRFFGQDEGFSCVHERKRNLSLLDSTL